MHLGERPTGFDGHCPVVTVHARVGRTEVQIGAALGAVARAVSETLVVPLEDVWVYWEDLR